MSTAQTLIAGDVFTSPDSWAYDVAIVGLGYVGLPTALAFRTAGVRVLGVDVSPNRIAAIHAGDVDLVPSDHDRLHAANNLTSNDEWYTTTDATTLSQARVVIVCVPTPIDAHAVPDLRALEGACRSVVAHARPGQVLMLTSTSYAGCTNDLLVQPLAARGLRAGHDLYVAFSPERINPADESFAHEAVPRVVGGTTAACAEAAAEALRTYVTTTHIVPSLEAAEMAKLLENTFRAVNIAFINEFASVCRALDIPVSDVIDAAATKPYGFMPFQPGPGVGGHCIPCDPHYLLWQLRSHKVQAPILEQAMHGLSVRPRAVVDRVKQMLADAPVRPADATVLVVGVAYKPNVADVRESTALDIIELLRADGINVQFQDPFVSSVRLADGSTLTAVDEHAVPHADVVLLHTRHARLDLDWLSKQSNVLDASYSLGADIPHTLI